MKQEKIWYLLIDGGEFGPFSFNDLRIDPRVTPRTLAKKPLWKEWKQIGTIPELQSLFQDPQDLHEPDLKKPSFKTIALDDEIAINLNKQNPLLLILIIILSFILLISYYAIN